MRTLIMMRKNAQEEMNKSHEKDVKIRKKIDYLLIKLRNTKYLSFVESLDEWFRDKGDLTEKQMVALRKFD